MFIDASEVQMGIGQNAGSATSQVQIASDSTRILAPNGQALVQVTDGSAFVADVLRTNPASMTFNSNSSTNGQISIVGDFTPNTDDVFDGGNLNSQFAWRNWYVRRALGGCNTLANRPGCAIGILIEGAHYSVCAVPGVSNGAEYVCHCASNGACAWQ
jgi:hypothetical protein